MLTPQEFSKRRHEKDVQALEIQRVNRQKMMEAHQRQIQMQRAAQHGAIATPGGQVQQRPGTATGPQQQAQMQPNGQQTANMNGQLPQQARPPLPMATRNGHLAVPQVNAQGIPQAQMRAAGAMSQHDMQRYAQANAQRSAQYGGQQYQMPNAATPSPGGGMTTQQQLHSNQALLAQLSAQNHANHLPHNQNPLQGTGAHPMSASPSMAPPPTPHTQPQTLSSGHVPALILIKNQLRKLHPQLSEDQLNSAATTQLREQHNNQSSSQVRQAAMNAAAGMPAQPHGNNMQGYVQNQSQTAYQNNPTQMPNGNQAYISNDANGQPRPNGATNNPQAAYANQMRQRHQVPIQHQSPGMAHAQLNGSPGMAHVSPSMAPISPAMQYAHMAAAAGGTGQRPPSSGSIPQMQRMGSAGTGSGAVQSPGSLPQGSPRNMQASMAR